jgi:phytanoyl-CoA hydroxylase
MHDDNANLLSLRNDPQRDGYLRIPRSAFCLDDQCVKSLRRAFAKLFDGQYETGVYPDEVHWRKGISRETATREICNGWKADSCVASTVRSKELGQLACALMGWPCSSRIGQDDVLHKPPNSGPVGFHQDGRYISDNFVPEDSNCLTMWIALDDADSENGALQYAPGSHLWHKKPPSIDAEAKNEEKGSIDMASLSFHVAEGQDYLTSLRQAAENAGRDPEEAVQSITTVPVKTGEMVVHLQDTWHGSGPNMSTNRHRRALVVHLLNGEVQWRPHSQPHYIYGRYFIRGESVPRDDFFPFTYVCDRD